ncbi:RlpA-like double-psi beta-barrel domain-containing protein [Pontibacter roseus]|uniref:hypothetical protein n=1 Tax=Pontibacter roseus TaxID=336989 RepID=UPI00036B66E9|nr:hypothetical protein [Pontibacter roseus]
MISIFVAFADEMALLKAESSEPSEEKTEATHRPPTYIQKVQSPDELPETYTVSATVYFPERSQTDSDPLTTADGSKINPRNPKKHRWIALSRDMLSRWGGEIQYGDSIWVRGISDELDGMYIVRDTMNRRFRNRIDILVGRNDNIMGRWDNVEIARAEFPQEEELELDFKPSYYGLAMSK